MVGIIVVSCGHYPFTKFCIESIIRNTPRDLYRLCLVDNGSQDATKPWAKKLLSDCVLDRFIDNEKNLGACKAANQGTIWCLENNYDVLICANDHVVTPNWLPPLIEAPFEHSNPFVFYSVKFFRNLASIGQRIDRYKRLRVKYLQEDTYENLPFVLNEIYKDHNGIDGFAEFFVEKYKNNPYKKVNMTQWPGFVYYRNYVVEKTGLRDEEFLKFTLAGYADIDYYMRLSKLGFSIGVVKTSFVHHWGSITTRKNGLRPDNSRYKNSDFDIRNRNERAAIQYLNAKHKKRVRIPE
jgi:GT2 family glycosyltransferase